MKFYIPPYVSPWEAIATIQVMQAVGCTNAVSGCEGESAELLYTAGCTLSESVGADSVLLQYAEVFRRLEGANTDRFYSDELASASGFSTPVAEPHFVHCIPAARSGIVVCPFPAHNGLRLPSTVWQAIVRLLRTFNRPVFLLGERGQWQDECSYLESEILTELPVGMKLGYLASADLVVGVPNGWLWAAAGWHRPIITLYPENVPPHRWFPFASDKYGRLIYEPFNIQIPVVLAGMRQLISVL